MAAPMPTRRAFRPDSQYYRTTRRQRLRRPGVAAAGKGASLAVLGVAGFLLVWWALHGGLWPALFGYAGLAVVVAVAVFVVVSGKR